MVTYHELLLPIAALILFLQVGWAEACFFVDLHPEGQSDPATRTACWSEGGHRPVPREYPDLGRDDSEVYVWPPPDPAQVVISEYSGLVPDPPAEALMLELLNTERAAAGLQALELDIGLRELAREHGAEMVQLEYFDHISPNTGSPFDRMRAAGIDYLWAGENLARASDVYGAHQALMQSGRHRANILRPQFGRVGIGVLQTDSKRVLVQEFTN